MIGFPTVNESLYSSNYIDVDYFFGPFEIKDESGKLSNAEEENNINYDITNIDEGLLFSATMKLDEKTKLVHLMRLWKLKH